MAACWRFRWIGAAILGGTSILLVVLLVTHHRMQPPPVQPSSSRPPVAEASPPADLPDFDVDAVSVLEGEATWYRLTPNSLPLRRAWPGEFTAASDRIASGTYVRVHRIDAKGNPEKSIVVRVTDNGVHRKDTVLDLNRRAARALGMLKDGEARVRVEVLALKNATTDKPVGKKTDPPLNPKASEITDQPVATHRQEWQNARAKAEAQGTP